MGVEQDPPAFMAIQQVRSEQTVQRPKVSVCCAWYNRADYIHDTVDSLLSQEFDSFEIVVVNDGSPDPRVREILDNYDDPRLKVIHQENTGFTVAIRRAIEQSTGEYIAIQGAGDVSLPKRLGAQVAILDAEPQVGVVGCRYENVVFGGQGDGARIASKPRTLEPRLDHLLKGRNPFSHGEVMIRRNVYETVGGYRSFFKFAQDRDLWIRMGTKCEFRIVDKVLYERRVFFVDGIAADRSKLLLQQTLSNFARQCHYDRIENGRDYVDMYGQYAGLLRRRAPALADFCARQALQAFALDDDCEARFFSRVALREAWTPLSLVCALCLSISRRSRLVAKLVRDQLLKHQSAQQWSSTRGLTR